MNDKKSIKTDGIPANTIVMPLVAAIVILHIIAIFLVYESNRANREFAVIMQKTSECQQNVTFLQANNSTLSETAGAFVKMPTGRDGEFNAGPLLMYARELERGRSVQKIAEWFKTHNAGAEILSYIDTAAAASEKMYETQLHVIALMCSIYRRPPIPALSVIPAVPLTEEELAMTEKDREAYARGLITGKDYSLLRASVASCVDNCHRILQQVGEFALLECEKHIRNLRIWLWTIMIAIVIIMTLSFVLFYRWLITPLKVSAAQIASDQSMKQSSGFREMRLLVNAYNALLSRRDNLDAILRSAAETDALTELPNRYCLQHDMLGAGDDAGSMAVLVFDVNYLKRMNDTKGHLAGDRLLSTAAACIRECFWMEDNGRCYRIGGDEFAAVLLKCSEEEVKSRIERFLLATERENISVSVGYAYAEKTDENSFEELMKIADTRMYAQKKRAHELAHTADTAGSGN